MWWVIYIYSGFILRWNAINAEKNRKKKEKSWIAVYVLIVFLLTFYGLMKNCNVDTGCRYEYFYFIF